MTDSLYFKPFDTDVSCINAGLKWQEYLEAFENFMVMHNITDDRRTICTLLHVAGDQIVRIYATLRVNSETVDHETEKEADGTTAKKVPKVDKFADVCRKLTQYFNPKRSKMYERHVFSHLKQKPEEDIMSFVTRLRTAARYCEYTDVDDMICTQVLSYGTSEWLTTRAFSEKDEPTLQSILTLMLTKDVSSSRSKAMRDPTIDHNEESVNHVAHSSSQNSHRQQQSMRTHAAQQSRPTNQSGKACGYCGKDSNHSRCPAADSECRACGKKGHWDSVCRSRNKQAPSVPGQRQNNSRTSDRNRRQVNHVSDSSPASDKAPQYTEYNCFGVQRD